MMEVLISIFLTATSPPNPSQSSSNIWQNGSNNKNPHRLITIRLHISSLANYLFPLILTDVLAATRAASSIKQAQESFTLNVENNSMMPIFQSPSLVVDTSMLGAPKPDENNQGNDEQFSCIFFGAQFSQESVIDEALKELIQNLAREEEKTILSIECRAYRALSPLIVSSERLVSQHQGPILVVYMTPSPDSDEEFNKWYDKEHIPMLSVVPGWLSAKRFVLCASNYLSTGTMAEARKAPKYLALHELENTQVFEKAEYRAATSTPWRTEVMKSLKEKQRSVMEYVGQLTELAK